MEFVSVKYFESSAGGNEVWLIVHGDENYKWKIIGVPAFGLGLCYPNRKNGRKMRGLYSSQKSDLQIVYSTFTEGNYEMAYEGQS